MSWIQLIGLFFVNLFTNAVFYLILLGIAFVWGAMTFISKKKVFQKKVGFWAVFGTIQTAMCVWMILFLSHDIVVSDQVHISSPVGEIFGETRIGQTFKASYDGLRAVDVLMANYKRKVTGEMVFLLQRPEDSEDEIFQKTVDAGKIKDNRYFRFAFPLRADSKGKSYSFSFHAPDAEPGNALTIWSNDQDQYFQGEKWINGSREKGDLVFRTVYDAGVKKKIRIFLNKVTQDKPFPLNKKWFPAAWVLLFFIIAGLFLTFMMKVFDEQRK
ncbi:MAG: hypothetical protein GF421_03105 [Candidatus Aminicenantes bacterium]|nr:hypothetical protein [Candidatus Aminicenantes bacterium]